MTVTLPVPEAPTDIIRKEIVKIVEEQQHKKAKIEVFPGDLWFNSINNVQYLVNQLQTHYMTLETAQRQIAACSDALYEAISNIRDKKPTMEIVNIEEEADTLE